MPVRRRKRRRLGNSTVPAAPLTAERTDHEWAVDFQFDQAANSRMLEAAARRRRVPARPSSSSVADGIDADRTVAVPARIIATRGRSPEFIRCDNGPELTANALRDWCRFSRGQRAYRARLSVAERLMWSPSLTHPRRAARCRDLLLPRRGTGDGRGLARGLQRAPATLSPRHARTRRVRVGMEARQGPESSFLGVGRERMRGRNCSSCQQQ